MECPDELYDALVSTWDQNPQYVDICDIIVDSIDGEDEEGGEEQGSEDGDDDQDPTLVHTFYRYVHIVKTFTYPSAHSSTVYDTR